MRKLSLKEKVAASIGVLLVLSLLPVYSAFFASNSKEPLLSLPVDTRIINDIQEAFVDIDIEIKDLIMGSGPTAQLGDTLYIHYVGLLKDGTTFDTSVNGNDPFVLSLGAGQVISGWELGLKGMRAGGTRRLVVPPALGYGDSEIIARDGTVLVPSNATLVFDIVLLKVEK